MNVELNLQLPYEYKNMNNFQLTAPMRWRFIVRNRR